MATGFPRQSSLPPGFEYTPAQVRAILNPRDGHRPEDWYRRRSASTPLVCSVTNFYPIRILELFLQALSVDARVTQLELWLFPMFSKNLTQALFDQSSQREVLAGCKGFCLSRQLIGYFDGGLQYGCPYLTMYIPILR